ncbi:MAG: hypothetical protein WCE72_17485, partial [Pseudolabrys sp.]
STRCPPGRAELVLKSYGEFQPNDPNNDQTNAGEAERCRRLAEKIDPKRCGALRPIAQPTSDNPARKR